MKLKEKRQMSAICHQSNSFFQKELPRELSLYPFLLCLCLVSGVLSRLTSSSTWNFNDDIGTLCKSRNEKSIIRNLCRDSVDICRQATLK